MSDTPVNSQETKLTNGDILVIWKNLHLLQGLEGAKFNFGVERNVQRMRPIIKSLDKARELSEPLKEMAKKHQELVEKFFKKEVNPEDPNTFLFKAIPGKQSEYLAAVKELDDEYQEELDKREKQMEGYKELLLEPADLEFYKIKEEYVPENIKREQSQLVFHMIDFKEE